MEKRVINVSIVEDHSDVVEFLENTFNESPDFNCLQSYRNAEEAILFLPKSNADVVIVDIGLPDQNGIECVRQVKSIRPDIQFMMYTIFDRNNNIFESLKAGASGYLLKSLKKEKIIASVAEVFHGGAPMSPAIAKKVTEFFFKGNGTKNNSFKELKLLGKREVEVLNLLSKGLFYKEIASEMSITEGTVKQHIHNIYKKLHVQNRTEAINKYLGLNPT